MQQAGKTHWGGRKQHGHRHGSEQKRVSIAMARSRKEALEEERDEADLQRAIELSTLAEAPPRDYNAEERIRILEAELEEARRLLDMRDQCLARFEETGNEDLFVLREENHRLEEENAQLQAALHGNEEAAEAPPLDEADRCVICMDATKTHIVYPCYHMCVCQECADFIQPDTPCPVCRTPCKETNKVF